jgi:hypothetical protein
MPESRAEAAGGLGARGVRCYEGAMETREQTFTLRFSLTAEIPAELWEDDDFEDDAWLDEWETAIKPGLIRAVFTHLRTFPGWQAHVRNRGVSPLDEIEIVVTRRFGNGAAREG